MITETNFKDLLKTLEFTEEGNIFQKSIGEADLKVDFSKQSIIYPENRGLKVNERQTCNFSQNENFVVFECVHRLLEKGYKPEHLELEPRWRVGRGASGGRADILVRDHEKNPLLIIECKTAGDEFERAWRKTEQDGDQLFSYAQQIRRTQYLCLYASDFVENNIRIDQRIISHRDDENILVQNRTSMSFAEAADVEDRYTVWRDTYQLESAENGIFEDNIQAYRIGKNKYTLAEDTKPIDASDKEGKYHEFRTILRKHNIARREHAFEVLVNLFLCKLVDEEDNTTDLKFYWKGITYDNYFDFVDRLQDLYRKGMHKFLNEEISYISNEQIDNAFWTIKNKRNATKQQIQRYFRELKFFTNSAFSLLDTHNEELFKRNTKVLSEIVQMWQGLRLKTDTPNQFLGDMFEMFLDDGVKQSEGQFFTPLPICKFIVASLPLAEKIKETPEPLKVIDYACGSGHFLNEYAYQIRPLVETHYRDISDYYSQITGIEKEDRLAKVAKVAAYMHGQEQIKILDADALTAHPEIQQETFDVLIANPPFAVEGFLQTLNEEDKKAYQLIKATGEDSNTNNIECFFLERLHHLMAPSGIVGVIVPSSILSNRDAVYIRTRELLLQFFDIVSIAELGSGTFGKTGTNTVVLFLRRKAQRPELAEHYRNQVDDFFEGDRESEEYQDDYLIKAYCEYIEVPYEEYIKLFAQTSRVPLSKLLQYDIFKEYEQAFEKSKKAKDLKKSSVFKKKTKAERNAELDRFFIPDLHNVEKEKLYYFILAHEQSSNVLIVKAPGKTGEQKQFLGYGWSTRKGEEGIKYEGGAKTVNDIITPLFAPKDLDSDIKINTAIKRNFIGEITDELPNYCHYANLTDMLNFTRIDFDKAISLNPKQHIETKWDLVRFGKVVETQYGYTANAEDEGDVRYLRITDITEDGRLKNTDKKYINPSEQIIQDYTLNPNDIVIARSGSTGRMLLYKGIDEQLIFASYLVRLKVSKEIMPEYIFAFHKTTAYWKQVDALTKILAQPNLNAERMKEIKIPLPTLEVQKQIVDECEAIDQETDKASQTITTSKQAIEEKVQAVINSGHEMKRLEDIADIKSGGTPSRNNKAYWKNGMIPWLRSEVCKETYISENIEYECITEEGLNNSSAKWLTSDTTLVALVGATKGKTAFLTFKATTNQNMAGIKSLSKNILDIYIFYSLKSLYHQIIQDLSQYDMLNLTKIRNIRIPIPPLNIQQQLVEEIEQLEAKITEAQALIDKATERKNAIVTKYL
ncbi:MAG: restriction endonuclease subunit S [Candidatus Poribacteria bacterium]|nr:restriction endonuclease subunit S [Candidatus Poribacteria bacterium]